MKKLSLVQLEALKKASSKKDELLFESVSISNSEISYKIHEDREKLNYIITFFRKGKQIRPSGEHCVYALPEQGLEVAKAMAESTIKEYL